MWNPPITDDRWIPHIQLLSSNDTLMNRPPLHSEAELRHYDRQHSAQQYAYDITARLTYFVVSAELVFCGYVLLNAEKFAQVKYSSILFLVSGLAAFFGVFWRFTYNQTYHDRAHGVTPSKPLRIFQICVYWAYVGLTIIFFSTILWRGYIHLSELETKATSSVEATDNKSELNKTLQPTAESGG